jgi:hypothetical protein
MVGAGDGPTHPAAEGTCSANALDFLPGVTLQAFPWRAIGQVLATDAPECRSLAGRARFTVRPGAAAAVAVAAAASAADDDSSAPPLLLPRSTVVEGAGDLSATIRHSHLLINVAACNLTVRSGQDDPLAAFRAAAAGAALRVSAAAQVGEDAYAGVTYDLATRRPELSVCWTGYTPTERAALSVHADPVDRSVRLRAAVCFPGPEWRGDRLDDRTGLVDFVEDDGGRHALWVEHEARPGDALLATRAGARLDVGRALNWLAAAVDIHVRPRLPRGLWRLPGAGAAYNFLIPPEDEDMFRYRVSGWELDVACSDATRPGESTRLALTRRMRLEPKRALGLTEDSEVALEKEADARLAALAASGRTGPEAEAEELDAMLTVLRHRASKAGPREEGGGRKGGGRAASSASAAARRAARRRLEQAGYSLTEDEETRERYGMDKRARRPGVAMAVGAAYDLGTGALGAELRLGSALRAVAGVGTLSRSGGLAVAPSLTLSIEPLALF